MSGRKAAWLRTMASALAVVSWHGPWLMLAPAALPGCAGSSVSQKSAVEKNDAVLTIMSNVPDAEVWIDDRFIAQARQLPRGVAMRAGDHRLEVRHDRHHTHYQELTLAARERITIEIELAPVLP